MKKDAAILETHKAQMRLASINPNCFLEYTAAALRTKDTNELTWKCIATTLIADYDARHTSKKQISIGSGPAQFNGSKNWRKRLKRHKRSSKLFLRPKR